MPQGPYTPRRGSPISPVDYSRSPSPTYSRSRSRSRSGRRISFSRSPSRSRPQSRRTSRRGSISSESSGRSSSPGDRSRRTRVKDKLKDAKHKTDTTSGLKTSLVFLGSVAAATYAAHKFWPKGITYGEKEEWEIEKAVKKEKAKRAAEIEDFGRDGRPSRRGDERLAAGDRMKDRGYDQPRSSQGRLAVADLPRRSGGPNADFEEVVYVRRPASTNRALPERLTTMSVAGGSRTSDARRAQYVEDTRTVMPDRRSYVQPRPREEDDYMTAPRYAEYEKRRYSYDEPAEARRGQRISTRQDDGYR